MKRYLVLLVTAILLLAALVIPGAVTASRQSAADKGLAPTTFNQGSLAKRRSALQMGGPYFKKNSGFGVSRPLREIAAEQDRANYVKENSKKYGKEEREVGRNNSKEIRKIDPNVVPDRDAALALFADSDNKGEKDAPTVLPTPSLVFDGNSNQDNANLFGFRLSPPDTEGDVGPNHYVQVINLTIRIFDKSGTPLTAPAKFSSIFSDPNSAHPCEVEDGGDPITLYDPMADRWLLSQFCFPFGDTTPPFFESIAISQTPDPTGAYYLYHFEVSAGNNQFPDYPHLGVWPDGYYMTTNQFLNGITFDGGGVFAFDREKMLVGDPDAGFIYFNRNLAMFPEAQAGMLPADMDGVNPPPPGAPCPFAYFTATEFTDPADGMRIFDFHADFDTPANSTFIERPESAAIPGGGIPVAAFNPLSPTGRDDVPQPPPASNTTARLDSISDRVMHRLQYINFGTHESLAVTHTVNVGTDQTLANYRAGIRYYQFRRTGPPISPWTVFDQGTYAGPGGDTTTHRWMGSAAMNAAGDLAVGYSASSASIFPSIRYGARFAADPLGSLAQGEAEIFTGTGVQTDTGSRWGDYSALSLDPSDDCSFWYTTETYTAASQATSGVGWITKIAKFNLGTACTAFPKGRIGGTVTNCTTGLPVDDAIVTTNTGFFDDTEATGAYLTPQMAPGTVNVSATKAGFSTATQNGVTVTNGNTTTVNLCIAPINIFNNAGSSIVNAGANGVPDPGETITVSLAVQDVGGPGACTTANLTGTLQSTGGVTNPTPPSQNYGMTCSGDPAVARNFTFTVDPNLACGATITATLQLQDGATNYGTFTYTFQTGQLGAPVVTSYTGPPVVIPDNVPAGVNIPINVSGVSGAIGDVDFRIDGTSCSSAIGATTVGVEHTWVGDLSFKLTSPGGGATVAVIDRPGSDTSFGSSGNNFCQTLLDDDAGGPSIESITSTGTPPLGPPYTGTFSAANPLSGFDGLNANGQWTLNVSDNLGTDTGNVRAFTLTVRGRTCDSAPAAPDATQFDFSGDGRADLSYLSDGSVIWTLQDIGSLSSVPSVFNWGADGDIVVPADYNGDLRADVAVFRPSEGNWYVINSGGSPSVTGWGQNGDRPVPGDYDNDDVDDLAVFRPSEGNWYVRMSGGGSLVAGWGNASDVLVPGDYNGDGRHDFAVYRPSEGNWYIRTNPASGSPSVIFRNWGAGAADIPVPADYDGDGSTDIAIYRPSEKNFYIINSMGGTVTIKSWGISGDVLVPADYDGDGLADIATYRGGEWWILQSATNTVFSVGGGPPVSGDGDDTPVPSVYISGPNIP